MEEGTFVGWLKKDGEFVRAGEALFTLDGDKALQEIEATDTGVLQIPPHAPQPGSTVRVGELLGYLVAEADRSSHSPPPLPRSDVTSPKLPHASPAPSHQAARQRETPDLQTRRRAVSPRALRAAQQLGMDWANLPGTGRGGRIRERDVLAAASGSRPATQTGPIRHGTIAITDWTFPDLAVEESILKPLGHQIVARRCQTEAELIALSSEADVVLTQFARVNANVIAALTKARALVRYGIGVDNIDLDAASARGIPVCNVPDYCIHEVADHTIALLLSLTRQVMTHASDVRSGQWRLAAPLSDMKALEPLTIGVVGFGRIGREVVARLRPFRCRVLVFDPVVAADAIAAGGAQAAPLAQILSSADVLTLHCPSSPQTRKMISAATFAQMKRGALFINVARGDLVDAMALVQALESGQVAGAALDVCDPEPVPAGHALLKFANVILTPHIASASPSAVQKLRQTVAHLAAVALRGQLPPNVVNGVTAPRLTD
jgi:D-3-phosphoglycerate dehydrogenase